jgi:hypothetical protein
MVRVHMGTVAGRAERKSPSGDFGLLQSLFKIDLVGLMLDFEVGRLVKK